MLRNALLDDALVSRLQAGLCYKKDLHEAGSSADDDLLRRDSNEHAGKCRIPDDRES